MVLTKGTILVRADRITVRQDPEGFQISVATGKPARFRQKRDGKDEWIDGDALTIEIDDKKERIDLREHYLNSRAITYGALIVGLILFSAYRYLFGGARSVRGAPDVLFVGGVPALPGGQGG